MKLADPHHHLWDLELNRYPWLQDEPLDALFGEYSAIRRSYRVSDFLEDAAALDLRKSVHIQSEFDPGDPVGETRWLQAVADDPASKGFPHGIVGFCNFAEPNAQAVLESHASHRNFRGIRQLLNLHNNPSKAFTQVDYLADPMWLERYRLLQRFQASFDLQVYYPQMDAAAQLAAATPNILMILNHAGMPLDRTREGLASWRKGLRDLARLDNVVAKISGLGMIDHHWTIESIRPFVLDVIDIFGSRRSMFASNFPVDKLFSSYGAIWTAFDRITQSFTETERANMFYENSVLYYRLGE